MTQPRIVVITGAAGTLGSKLRHHLEGKAQLRLLDRVTHNDPAIRPADLSSWSEWVEDFRDADTVFHFAADPEAYKPWTDLIGPNVDALINVFQAAAQAKVKRVVFASSNHVMGGYQDEPNVLLSSDTPPRPGLKYLTNAIPRSSTPYAAAKLFGERLGRCYSESFGLETVAVRIGWVWRGGPNQPENLPSERGEWFRLMWLSDRDFLHLMERCLLADLPQKFIIVNGMSNNAGMPWDLEPGRRLLGFDPQDDVTKSTLPWSPSSAKTLGSLDKARIVDLTLPMRRGLRGYDREPRYTLEDDGWNASTVHLYSHAGTHMDAQIHFAAGSETIDRIDLGRCCGWARVVRLPGMAPKEEITIDHLGRVAISFREGEVLLLATGWSRHIEDSTRYRDGLPRIGAKLARWCVDRRVKLVGVEPPSVADVNNLAELTQIHQILLGGGVGIVEGLVNLDQLPAEGAWFMAAPLKIEGGDGCPCRALAFIEGETGAR